MRRAPGAALLALALAGACRPAPPPVDTSPAAARARPDATPVAGPAGPVPADFSVRYSRRGGTPDTWQAAEIATPACRRNCVALTEAEKARLHAAFTGRAFVRMTAHHLNASPHRGGVCLAARWEGQRHEVCDLATSEIDQAWRAGFDALTRETEDVFRAALARAADGGAAR